MPRNGSGTYSRAVTPPVNGDVADADDFNDEMNDIATAITNSLAKNGETTPTANLPMGGFILTGLGAGSANGHSVRFEQVQPIDATLTALAALSWSASSQVPTFTAADTVSLTTVISGTYTPTATNTTNIAASTPALAQYMRVGSVVTVSGEVLIDPTATGDIELGLTLPIASNLGAASDVAGTAATSNAAGYGVVFGDAANDRATLSGNATVDAVARTWRYTFTYRII